MKKQTMKPPFCHFELLSQRGEDEIGKDSYVYVLPTDYRTNTAVTDILRANIKHSADVMNSKYYGDGSVQQDLEHFPYVRYLEFSADPLRHNCWVFVSMRNVTDTTIVKDWMDEVVSVFPPAIPDVGESPIADYKLRWNSPDIK